MKTKICRKIEVNMKKKDYEQDPVVICEVSSNKTHYSITAEEQNGEGRCGFGLDKKYGYKPKVGDVVILYSAGGCEVRGMKINGKQVFYKTQKQVDADHAAWCAKYHEQRRKLFQKEKKSLDKKYKSLPEPFRKRLDFFRNEDPNFRVESESYEMFCLTEAVKIAEAMKTPEEVVKFQKMTFDEQVKLAGIEEGHSGNTFGSACNLAYWLLKDPTKVFKEKK